MEVDSAIMLDPDQERMYNDQYMRDRNAFAIADALGKFSIEDLPVDSRGRPMPPLGRGAHPGMGGRGGPPPGGRGGRHPFEYEDETFRDRPRGRDAPRGGPQQFAFRRSRSRGIGAPHRRGETILHRDKVARRALDDLKYPYEPNPDNRDEFIVPMKLTEKEVRRLEDLTQWMRTG